MNLNGDEKRIQQLFRELSIDDQRQAPEFIDVLASANSGVTRSRNRTRSLRFALAGAMLFAALLIAMAIIVRPSRPQGPPARDDLVAVPQLPPETPPGVDPSGPGGEVSGVKTRKTIVRRARPRGTSTQMAIAMKSLFAWRSPTASLLKTPGDELLKSLPRLGESLRTMKSFSPEQFN